MTRDRQPSVSSNVPSIRATRQAIREGRDSLEQVVSRFLAAISAGRDINAFITVFDEQALEAARRIDGQIRSGTAGPLAGAVIAVKDNIAVKDCLMTCGSRILHNFIPPYDATVISRLQEAGAVIIGKTNLDEFAMGSSSEHSASGAVRNPLAPEHVAGGSSGGSAAAVAAGYCHAALGSDTGGSIRQPAAFTGVFGMKPTYGRVSRFGLTAFASSLDQIGPLARSTDDLAAVLQVISGHDPLDGTSAQEPVPDFSASVASLNGKTIGIPAQYLGEGVQPEIAAAVDAAAEKARSNGAKVVSVDLPMTDYAIATYYLICTAEASSNLARYDGAHYGYRAEGVRSLEEMYTRSRSEGFGEEVKRRIMLGTYVLSAGYYDAYYRRAMKARSLIRHDFEQAFATCDLLLTPTTPTTAFRSGEKTTDPLAMYLSDIFTVSVNLAGLPAISFPYGRDDQGLPIGLQCIAPAFDEISLLGAARFFEQNG